MAFSKLSSLAGRDWSPARAAIGGHPRIGHHHYDPNQPRVPAGRPDGGQWTSVGGSESEAARRWLEIFELAATRSWRAAVAIPDMPRPGYTPLASAFLTPGAFQLASMLRLPGQRIPGVTDPPEGGGGGGRNTGGGAVSARPIRSGRTAAEQLEINKKAGAKFEDSTRAILEQQDRAVGAQVTLETRSGRRTRMDFLTRRRATGLIECIECKASPTAPVRRNQIEAFREIKKSGATVVGEGKPGFPGGTKVPPRRVKIIRGP
jgi:hypothetical protein